MAPTLRRRLATVALLFLSAALARGDDSDRRAGSGLRFASSGGAFRLRVGGNLTLEAITLERDGHVDENSAEVRRARLAASLDFTQHLQLRLSYEFAGRDPGWRNAWLGWESGRRRFRIGQFQQPFSLEELTGSTELTFVSRALPNLFAPSYRLGAETRLGGTAWTFAGAVFRGDLERPDADNLGAAVRWTRAQELGERSLFHFGLAGLYRQPGERILRFRSRPEVGLGPVLVDTDRMRGVESVAGGGLELAFQSERLLVQGEGMAMWLARDAGRRAVLLDGGYVAASFRLAGERRRYRRGSGSFTAVRGAGRTWGWELAARWSVLDLDDGAVRGGKLADWTLGLSGAWADWGRLLLDVVHADSRRHGRSEALDAVVLQLQLRL